MSRRSLVIGAVLLCINLPGALALAAGASFYARNRSSGFIVVEGERRGYVLHVPQSLDRSKPVPLVISLHGAGLWGGAQRDISGWNELADRAGFVVAYPSGTGHASPRVWAPHPGPELRRDVAFLTQLIDTLVARYDVDPQRVYVNGLSNGGGMSFALSCLAPARVAAVGIVSGAQTQPWDICKDAPPVPVLVMHGTADPDVPYRGGVTWVSSQPFPDTRGWVQRWAERNGCESTPHDSVVAAGVTRRAYTGCVGDADVALYTLEGDGHVWPGGGRVPEWLAGPDLDLIDANEVMWQFFRDRRAGQ